MSTFRSFSLSTNWILDKDDRYEQFGSDGTLHQIRTVGVTQTWSASDAHDAEDPVIHTNVHLSGVLLDPETGKKIKGSVCQDNEDFTDNLPQFIQRELEDLWKVRSTLWHKSKGPVRVAVPV